MGKKGSATVHDIFWGIARVFGAVMTVVIDDNGRIRNASTGVAVLGIDPRSVTFETRRRFQNRLVKAGSANFRSGSVAASAMKIATWRYVGLESVLTTATVCKDAGLDVAAILAASYEFYGVESAQKAA